MGILVFDAGFLAAVTELSVISGLELAEAFLEFAEMTIAVANLVLGEKDYEKLVLITQHISDQLDFIAASQGEVINELITIDSDIRIGFSTFDNELNNVGKEIITELTIVDNDIVNEIQSLNIDIVNELQTFDKDVVIELQIVDNDIVNQVVLLGNIVDVIKRSTCVIVSKLKMIDKNIVDEVKSVKCAISANNMNICNKLDAISDILDKLHNTNTENDVMKQCIDSK
jgi:hypothetical protein